MKKILCSGMVNQSKQFEEINIQWAITRKCNFCCDFCGVYDNNQKELSLEDNMKIIEKIFNIYPSKKKTIVVIGGEPTLYNEYEKILSELIIHKNKEDVICLFSNGSENIKKFQNNIHLYEHVIPLFTFHTNNKYGDNALKEKLDILYQNNISFKVNMMIMPNNLEIVKSFYKSVEKYHHDNFIFECVPIEQFNSEFLKLNDYVSFCQYVNNKNSVESFMDVFYQIYDTETKQENIETYTQSQLKLLSKEYFKFIGYRCFSRYRLSIDCDGLLYDFCDRCHYDKAKNIDSVLTISIQQLEKLISEYRLCKHMYCPVCDTSLLYKERLNIKKYKGD